MPIDLNGKPIAITGASSGIGLATALRCARAGMPVVLAARREDRLRDAAQQIEAEGGRVAYRVCDVADAQQCRDLVSFTEDTFGPIYAALANAGYGFETCSAKVRDDELRRIFDVNFFGTIDFARAAAERMLDHGRGHILITSSCIGKLPVPYFGPYCATKAAQWHMASAMRWELASRNIAVSSIHPVGTKTEFFDQAKSLSKPPTDAGDSLDDHTPQWMMQRADTVAHAIFKCLRKPKSEVWPSWAVFVRLGMALANAFPAVPGVFFKHGMVKKYEDRERDARADAK